MNVNTLTRGRLLWSQYVAITTLYITEPPGPVFISYLQLQNVTITILK